MSGRRSFPFPAPKLPLRLTITGLWRLLTSWTQSVGEGVLSLVLSVKACCPLRQIWAELCLLLTTSTIPRPISTTGTRPVGVFPQPGASQPSPHASSLPSLVPLRPFLVSRARPYPLLSPRASHRTTRPSSSPKKQETCQQVVIADILIFCCTFLVTWYAADFLRMHSFHQLLKTGLPTLGGCLSHQLRKFIAGLLLYAHRDQLGVQIHHRHPASSKGYESEG